MKLYWVELPRQRSLFLLVGSLLGIGGIIGVLHLCGVMVCPLRKYTGLPCFTCGSTRAVFALLQGEVRAAFLVQPLVSSFVLFLTPLAGLYLYTGFIQRRLPHLSLSTQEKRVFFIVIILLTLLNWSYLLRSTP